MKNKFSGLFRYCQICKNNKWLKSKIFNKHVGAKYYYCKHCNFKFTKCNADYFRVSIREAGNDDSNYFYSYFYISDNYTYLDMKYEYRDCFYNFKKFDIKTDPIDIFKYAISVVKNKDLF